MASQWPLPPSTCFSFTFYATIWILFFPCSVTFMYPAAPTKKPNFLLNPVSLSFSIPLRNLQKYSYFRIFGWDGRQNYQKTSKIQRVAVAPISCGRTGGLPADRVASQLADAGNILLHSIPFCKQKSCEHRIFMIVFLNGHAFGLSSSNSC